MFLPLEPEKYEELTQRLSKVLGKKVSSIHDIIEGNVDYVSKYARKIMKFKIAPEVPKLSEREIEALCEENSYNFGFRLEMDDERNCVANISID